MKSGQYSDLGKRGEDEAARFLVSAGYRILARNFRVRCGEIDIIAKKRDEIVFVEVKTGACNDYGYPEERVSDIKCQRISRTIREYLRRLHIPEGTYMRFDIIACEWSEAGRRFSVRHIPNVPLQPR